MKMETLKGEIVDSFPLQNLLIRVVDVVNFEGPLLTLYENVSNRQLYLFDWVDKDTQFNRWLVYRCNPYVLDSFINKSVSHYDLFTSDENTCYTIDIDKSLQWHNIQLVNKLDIPKSYIPSKNAYFEECDSPNLIRLNACVNQAKASSEFVKLVEGKNASHFMTFSIEEFLIYAVKKGDKEEINFVTRITNGDLYDKIIEHTGLAKK